MVAVPVEGNAATVDLTAMFSDARGELISAPAEFAVTQSLTPVGAIDYVDLGDGAATDDPAPLSASTVRVRIRHNASASGYDPSIADVWSLPLP